jgi:hypothetical protein
MEPESSLTYSQQPDTAPFLEPGDASPHLPTLFIEEPL